MWKGRGTGGDPMATTVFRVSPALVETAREQVAALLAAHEPVSPELQQLAAARLARDESPENESPVQR
jgi:hypothetical protein